MNPFSLRTERLRLRHFELNDAPLILELLNSPGWLQFIGDRGIKTLADAEKYLLNGPITMYETLGFGPYHLSLTGDGTPIGMCGPIKRETLDDVDIGFALLPEFTGHGYMLEAARAVLAHARDDLKLPRLAGITTPGNTGSIRVLETIGLRFERAVRLAPDAVELNFYAIKL